MKTKLLVAIMTLSPVFSYGQESFMSSSQAIYLTTLGSKTLFVFSYESRFAEEFAVHGGAGLNNFDRTSSTTFRFGVSYLRGTEHMLELSMMVDLWTKVLNPIAREDIFPVYFVGYRYQSTPGAVFRIGVNPLQLDESFFDTSEMIQNVLMVSAGYSF